jgi:hypothetical protein
MLRVFQAGIKAEEEVWAKGIVKGRAQEYVELPISESIRVAGHLDCWSPEGRIYEVKSQGDDEWKPIREGRLWERYKFQISVYMWATGLPLTVVRVRRGREGGIEEEVKEEFETPPVSLEGIRGRVFEVEMLARRDLSEVGCEKVEYPCPFFYTHTTVGDELVREAVDDPAAVVLAQQYRNARVVAEVANSRVRASRGALLDYMGERRRLDLSDGTLLTRYEVKGKHVEYDRAGYWALRVTTKKETGGEGGERTAGETSGDSL